MVDNDEQVASGNGASSDNNNTLCDIIAQQREFQLRQEARSMQATFSGRNRPPQQQGKQSNDWRQSNATDSSSNQNDTNNNNTQNTKHKTQSRRKFSLSYAMSNLAPFAGTSSSSTSSSTAGQCSSGASSASDKPKRSLDHRSSPVRDELGQQVPATAGPGVPAPPATSQGHNERSEKKKSFVHKAIRRGSKLFDSMLLSSAQQQADSEKQQQQQQQQQKNFTKQPEDSPTRENTESNQQPPLQQRVQFAAEPRDELLELDTEPHKPRRRRLRLGSFQHDLRRALSLSSNSSHHKSHLTCRDEDDSLPDNGRSGAGSFSATSTRAETPASKTSTSLNSTSSTRKLAASRESGSGSGATTATRLKRKNSLFAPLTSAASSAFFHAHHHHNSQSARRRQSTVAGLGDQTGHRPTNSVASSSAAAAATQQTNSASFSLCQDHSRTYKLIIFGSSAVGKTSIIQRFLYGHFPVAHKPTVEELHSNKYNIPELGEIYLEILDTSGTFEFPAMRRLSIEKGDAFILVFSVADEASWQEVIHLRQLILEEKREQRLEEAGNSSKAAAANDNGFGNTPLGTGTGAGNPVTSSRPMQQPPPPPPISSVYAAASRLTSVGRRTSSSPGLEAPATRSDCTTTDLQIETPPPQAAVPVTQAGGPQAAPQILAPKSSAHYNSQLSKLLQNPAKQKRVGRNFLLQSLSIEDGNEEASAGGIQAINTACQDANTSGGGGSARSSDLDLEHDSSNSSSNSHEPKRDREHDHQHPPQPPPTRRRTPIVVVANKCDLDTSSHQVDQDEMERLVCDQWRNSFVKCSAKEALNIDRVFKELLRQARAPEILSQFVIDDHQQRRQSLPVLKNQLSAHHVKGLRSLYNQQQLQTTSGPSKIATSSPGSTSGGAQQQEPRSMSSASGNNDDSQCAIM